MSTDPAAPRGVEHVAIDADTAGQRIDNFLLARLKGVPKSRVYRLLRKGEVRVNKGRVKPEYRLAEGDSVRIPPVRRPEARPPLDPAVARPLDGRVIHEDSRVIVLDKPAGMAVHGGSGLSHGVIEALRAARPGEPYLELVHRLDRETSGCLLIARRRSALRELHRQIREGEMEKRYLALVEGSWQHGEVTLEDRLVKQRLQGGERMVRVDPEGQRAVSHFRLVEDYRKASLLEVRIETGRTHQIRVQAAHAGHPIAGDEKYGRRGFNANMRGLGLRRLFLHAHSLGYRDPGGEEWCAWDTPLPDELRAVLDRLESGGG